MMAQRLRRLLAAEPSVGHFDHYRVRPAGAIHFRPAILRCKARTRHKSKDQNRKGDAGQEPALPRGALFRNKWSHTCVGFHSHSTQFHPDDSGKRTLMAPPS